MFGVRFEDNVTLGVAACIALNLELQWYISVLWHKELAIHPLV